MLPSCAGRALGGPEKAWEWKPDRGRGVRAGLVTLQDVRFRENYLDIKNRKWKIVFHLSLKIKSESGLNLAAFYLGKYLIFDILKAVFT